ncbi:hypothetical protein K2Z83_11265 [Oscillochloris sp. ZM17-4]|uniref:hypothetical protein n=1 Tax=Oscillochloris sp. ZM17-4 TaxID=2866714 RepID=UPI001C735D89|nr:hypothetical protein [Oscillochloris sp. ZM17-4]MBX0328255.1 hypothetical protein [Oscillochloris sp. ZM17-4]
MPNLSIEASIPSLDQLDPLSQWGLLCNGVVEYAKAIIRALELAETIADANDLASVIATTEAGAGVGGSAELTKERAQAILAMATWFLGQVNQPLEDAGGLTPRQILYRYWQRPPTSA